MIVNGQIVELVRQVVSDALFGTQYSVLTAEGDVFLVNIMCAAILITTIVLFFKAIFWLFSFVGG